MKIPTDAVTEKGKTKKNSRRPSNQLGRMKRRQPFLPGVCRKREREKRRERTNVREPTNNRYRVLEKNGPDGNQKKKLKGTHHSDQRPNPKAPLSHIPPEKEEEAVSKLVS